MKKHSFQEHALSVLKVMGRPHWLFYGDRPVEQLSEDIAQALRMYPNIAMVAYERWLNDRELMESEDQK